MSTMRNKYASTNTAVAAARTTTSTDCARTAKKPPSDWRRKTPPRRPRTRMRSPSPRCGPRRLSRTHSSSSTKLTQAEEFAAAQYKMRKTPATTPGCARRRLRTRPATRHRTATKSRSRRAASDDHGHRRDPRRVATRAPDGPHA